MSHTYKIVRFFLDTKKPRMIIKTGLTLTQAQEHCQKETTKKPGKYFEGYSRDTYGR